MSGLLRSKVKASFSLRTFGMLLCIYIWVWLGVGNLLDAPAVRPDVIYLLAPPWMRAGVWLLAALVALITAWSRRGSIVGLLLLSIPPVAVIASYSYSMFIHLIPGGSEGYPQAYYLAAIYLALPGLVVMTALMPSAPVPRLETRS